MKIFSPSARDAHNSFKLAGLAFCDYRKCFKKMAEKLVIKLLTNEWESGLLQLNFSPKS